MLPGEQVAVDGHGHVSGDSEGAADESGGGEVGGWAFGGESNGQTSCCL